MKIEKNRHLDELLMLLDATSSLTSEYLARQTMSSVRTVKNDMFFLNTSLQKEEIAKIVSHKAKGYELVVLDQNKMDAFHKDLLVYHSLFLKRSIIETNRWLFIIQKLLTFSSVKKDELCTELYVSESTLSHNLATASDFMRSYSLKINSAVGKGICVEGKEQDKRACMVEVACSSYHDVELLYPVAEFDNMFYDSIETYQKIRHAFLKLLRESRMTTSDIASKKLATHLCLMRNRASHGCNPEISKKRQEEIKRTYEYEFAKQIFQDKIISQYLGNVEDIEVINFARLLIVNRDIDLRHTEDYDTLQTSYILKSSSIFKEVIHFMKEGPYHSFFEMDLFRIYEQDYESLFLMIYLKHYFDHTNGQKLITYVESDESLISPVAKDITRVMIEKMESLFGEAVDVIEVQGISAITDYMFDLVSFPYHRLRLATACMEGKVVANRIKEKMLRSYEKLIALDDVFDLYEMRRISFEDYDALIVASGPNLYYSYPIKMIAYDGLSSNYNKEKIFHDLFYFAFERDFLETIKNNTSVFCSTKMHNYEDFLDTLVFKYCSDDDNQKEQRQHLLDRHSIISYYYSQSATIIIFFDYAHCKKEFIDLYEPEQVVYLDDGIEVRYILAICITPSISVSNLKLTTKLLQTLVSENINFDMLREHSDETWEKLFYIALKKDFLEL
jgi:hypothetical protein